MRTISNLLSALVITTSIASLGHATTPCVAEKSAYDRAVIDYNRTEQQYNRLQFQVDTTAQQGEYRRAILEGNVEAAQGNLSAAQQGGLGQGVGCFFFPRANCFGSAINRATQRVASARANVRAQEGRLNAFVRAYDQQMTRLSQRVTEQEALVAQKKATLDVKETAYQACMAK